MSSEDVDSEEKRRQRSDEARRAALKLRIQEKKERERQIAEDIANVDKKATKRIVFEDSDEEDGQEEPSSTSKSTSSSSKKPKLFDSEDEDDGNEEKIDEELLKNRHSGPKGEKLMKLESRFNSDPRFKLDDKFAESDSEDEGNAEISAEREEMRQEKDKNRELLSKILGKSVEEKKPKTTTSDASGALLKARPFTRFDPENPEHLEWMKAFEAAKNPTKKTEKVEEKAAEKSDESSAENEDKEEEDDEDEKSGDEDFEKAEIFFKMDENFANQMKERKEGAETEASNGFSFLSSIGRKYAKEEPEDPEVKPEIADSDEKPEKVEKKPILKAKSVKTTFFVDPFSDEKIKSLAANFRRTQTVEKVIDKWAPHRDAIFKLWKKQRRDAVKKQKDSFFTNNGKRKRKAEENEGEKVSV